MATMFYDKDTDIDLIRQKKVAVIGYGSQGHAHALNLQDSGVEVVVGLQAGSKSADKAKAAGLKVLSVADASKWADVVMVLIPDQHQAKVYKADIAPHLTAGKMLMFAHGFAIRFNWIVPPHRTACSPKRSVSVSSAKVVSMTPARVQPMPLAYDSAVARPFPVTS